MKRKFGCSNVSVQKSLIMTLNYITLIISVALVSAPHSTFSGGSHVWDGVIKINTSGNIRKQGGRGEVDPLSANIGKK